VEVGISTFTRLFAKTKYGEMQPSVPLRQLQQENDGLKRLVADFKSTNGHASQFFSLQFLFLAKIARKSECKRYANGDLIRFAAL
jgi:hypothetical protein